MAIAIHQPTRTAFSTAHAPRRRRRPTLHQRDRRALERAGWRTMLEYRENHVRRADGTLLAVEAAWIAEAERDGAPTTVATAIAATPDQAWATLRDAVFR